MQITHNGKTYKWIGSSYGILLMCWTISLKDCVWTVLISDLFTDDEIVDTKHTPEQLVKLGYMELVEETKYQEAKRKWDIARAKARRLVEETNKIEEKGITLWQAMDMATEWNFSAEYIEYNKDWNIIPPPIEWGWREIKEVAVELPEFKIYDDIPLASSLRLHIENQDVAIKQLQSKIFHNK